MRIPTPTHRTPGRRHEFLAGSFRDTLDIAGPLTSAGESDAFVALLLVERLSVVPVLCISGVRFTHRPGARTPCATRPKATPIGGGWRTRG